MARRGKLMKVRYKELGIFSDADIEIHNILMEWKRICSARETALKKVKEFTSQIGTLETQIVNLNAQADSLKRDEVKLIDSLYSIFAEKERNAPTQTAIENDMDQITQFKKIYAPYDFDDNGNIINKEIGANKNGKCTSIER